MSKRSRGIRARSTQDRPTSEQHPVELRPTGVRARTQELQPSARRIRPYVLPGIFLVAALAGIAAIAAAAIGAPTTTNSTAIRPVIGCTTARKLYLTVSS